MNLTIVSISSIRLACLIVSRSLHFKPLHDACHAIESMQVRGAPLIGVTAVYGVYLALLEDPNQLAVAVDRLAATRPTAINLQWALDRMNAALRNTLVAEAS